MDAMGFLALLAAFIVIVMKITLSAAFPGLNLLLCVFFLAAALLISSVVWILESVSRKETGEVIENLNSILEISRSKNAFLNSENLKVGCQVRELQAEMLQYKEMSALKLKRVLEEKDALILSKFGLRSRVSALEAENLALKEEAKESRAKAFSTLELVVMEKSALLAEKAHWGEEMEKMKKSAEEAQQLARDLTLKMQLVLQEKHALLAGKNAPLPSSAAVTVPAVLPELVFVDIPRHKPKEPRLVGPKNWEKGSSEALLKRILRRSYLRQVQAEQLAAIRRGEERARERMLEKLRRENANRRAELEDMGEDTSDFEDDTLEEYERRQERFFGL